MDDGESVSLSSTHKEKPYVKKLTNKGEAFKSDLGANPFKQVSAFHELVNKRASKVDGTAKRKTL